jgi:hypothetical protein
MGQQQGAGVPDGLVVLADLRGLLLLPEPVLRVALLLRLDLPLRLPSRDGGLVALPEFVRGPLRSGG